LPVTSRISAEDGGEGEEAEETKVPVHGGRG
jgi:hypothetical protein